MANALKNIKKSEQVSQHDKNVMWAMYMQGLSVKQIKAKINKAKFYLNGSIGDNKIQ